MEVRLLPPEPPSHTFPQASRILRGRLSNLHAGDPVRIRERFLTARGRAVARLRMSQGLAVWRLRQGSLAWPAGQGGGGPF